MKERLHPTHAPAQRPAADPIVRGVIAVQQSHRLFVAGTPVVVGVSGGLDSVCLLHALQQIADDWGLALHVAHLDHALRADSPQDAELVRGLAQAAGLPFHTQRLPVDALSHAAEGLEAAARHARYAFLAAIAQQVGSADQPATIAVAHHQDDQAETLLMHLLTGSGLDGLSGMGWMTQLDAAGRPNTAGSIRLVRPFLGVTRAELHDYATAHGLIWREDASNRDPVRLRNRLRHEVLPLLATLNPSISATLTRSAQVLGAEADRAAQLDAAALSELLIEESPATRLLLDADGLRACHPATQRGVLRLALARLGADLRTVGFDHLERILVALDSRQAASGPTDLPGKLAWSILPADDAHPRRLSLHRGDALPCAAIQPWLAPGSSHAIPNPGTLAPSPQWRLVSAERPPDELPNGWRSRSAPWTVFLDADIADDLCLTTPTRGMKIAPLGMAGHRRSLGDIFTDGKIPADLRPGWPVVVQRASNQPLWLCGLTVGDTAAIRSTTRRVRTLSWLPAWETE